MIRQTLDAHRQRFLDSRKKPTTVESYGLAPPPVADGIDFPLEFNQDSAIDELETYGLAPPPEFDGIDFPLEAPSEFNQDSAIDELERSLMAESYERDGAPQELVEDIRSPSIPEPPIYNMGQEGVSEQAEEPLVSQVDYEFIKGVEGFETTGVVPKRRGKVLGTSGVTVGSGVDVGQWSAEEFTNLGVPQDIVDIIEPYFGVTGEAADQLNNAAPLVLTQEQAEVLTKIIKDDAVERVAKRFNAESDIPFAGLSKELQTTLASVAFQYNDLKSKTPNFWTQTTTGDWLGAYGNLLKFGDDYKTRRGKEARHIRNEMIEEYGLEAVEAVEKSVGR